MPIKMSRKDFAWMAAGATLLLLIVLLMFHYHREESPSIQLLSRARRLELVDGMQLQLSLSSEAEKSAVMAVTDQESQTFADQARAASAELERERTELRQMVEPSGADAERSLLVQFSQALDQCRKIDDGLLDLAVENTNLKAYSLAFGPAAEAIERMDGALAAILEDNVRSSSSEARRVMELAAGAGNGALRIQALLAPHISEESDRKMDSLETIMSREDMRVRRDLAALATLLPASHAEDLETARSGFARFSELRRQILHLSRQNTNVRSLTISLNQKRKALAICRDALTALAQAIREEPMNDRTPASPR